MRRLTSLCSLCASLLVLFAQASWAADSYRTNHSIQTAGMQADEGTFALTMGVAPSTAGSVSPNAERTLAAGSTISMRTTANSGYRFVNWTVGDSIVSTSMRFTFTMPEHDAHLVANYVYDPTNPANPYAPEETKQYKLQLDAQPANAGSFNINSGSSYAPGNSIYLVAKNNTGYVFDHWTSGDTIVATSRSFYLTMPDHDARVTAIYHYDPSSPANPDVPVKQYTVRLKTQPENAGSFNWSGSTKVTPGTSQTVYAYSNTGYRFREWLLDGEPVGTSQSYQFAMPAADVQLVAVYDYDPSNPGNPAKNYWNEETGEVIVDDFTAGSLNSAISTAIGSSSNRSKVQMITVSGRTSQYDWGMLNGYSNCTYLDLSRTNGMTYVPSWNFSDNTTLTSIALPASIERIENYAFYDCSNLSSISIHAMTPPEIGYRAFEGIADSIVYVPATAVALYQEAEGWRDFTILPFAREVSALEINLPEGTDVTKYKDMYIELINTNSGQRQRYVITNRLTYTFNSLIKRTSYNVYLKNAHGNVLGQIDNVEVGNEDVSVTFGQLLVPRDLTLRVTTPDGTDVTAQTAITWMDQKGVFLSRGSSLASQLEGTQVKFRIQLPQQLAMQYRLPADSVYTVESENALSYVLTALPQLTISGTVSDIKTGQPISGASIAVSQTLNGLYSKTFSARTDQQGRWTLTVFDAPTEITASMTDYVSKRQTLTAPTAEIPAFALKDINGTTISLALTYTDVNGETQAYYSDYANVAYTVVDEATGQPLTDLNVQYPQIVLMQQHPQGTMLRVTATSKNSKFVPVTATCTVDSLDRASATLPIKQLGGISASFRQTDNTSVVGILYDASGRLVKKYNYSSATLSIGELTDGDYTLVTMAGSQFFNSVAHVSQFGESGLKEGVDYVKNKVTVESGAMTAVSNQLIPYLDETKLYYTGDGTSLSVNKSQITVGQYLTLTSHIDFKAAYAGSVSDVKLIVDLPEQASFVEQSVMRGSQLASYTYDNHRLTVPLDYYGERVRFCFIPTAGGSFSPAASVQFTFDGKEITQPIGNANYTAENLSISVPSTVAKTTVPVSGSAQGRSAVQIFDNGMLVGQTTSLANGTWSTTIDLYEPKNLSAHGIYAKVVTQQGVEMVSETKTCTYDENAVEPKSVTMTFYNGYSRRNIEVVFDMETGKTSAGSYDFYTATDFTFLIDLSYNNINVIPFVWLHVYTSDSKVRSLRADYDEHKDRWVATDRFSSEALPNRVSVTVEDMVFDPSADATYETLIDSEVGEITLKETTEDEDGTSTSTYLDADGDDLATVSSYESDLTVEQTIEQLKQEGFEDDELIDDTSGYVPEDEDDVLEDTIKVLTDVEKSSIVLIGPRVGGGSNVVIIRLIREENKQTVDSIVSTITREWKSFFRTYFDESTCSQVTEYKRYQEHLDKYVTIITSSLVAHTIFVDYRKLPPGTKIPRKQVLARLKRVRHSSKRYTTWTIEYSVVPKVCRPDPPKPPLPPVQPVNPILDPSGYVYEAVSSNRLEGVTATVYYKETVEDMYGDLHENIVLWDAEEYAQQNPLFTDEDGMYRWDVPQGLWQVKFEKEGYQTAYSEWLPVPPPQLDVNIGMTQMMQPTVKSGKAFNEGIEFEFDKYMDPATLTADNILVTKNGLAQMGEITLLDEERASDDSEQTYARKVRFTVPEGEQLLATDAVQLTVRKAVESYAGVPMQEDYTQQFDVELHVTGMAVDSLVNVAYGGQRTLTVAALPTDAAKGKQVAVRALSTMIATVSTDTLTLDENGQAEFTVSGELPGSTVISFSVVDTDVTGTTAVNVKEATKLMAVAPRASRVSGTEVYRGTKILLSSETSGAVIYYTLDGSCPCDADNTARLTYSADAPIVIASDTVTIKAIATGHDLGESDVAEFKYTLKKTAVGYQMQEGWTWVSHNLEEAVPVSAFATNAERIVSQTQEVVSDPVAGLIGNLSELQPAEAYKVKVSAYTDNRIAGYEYNATQNAVALNAGWNWIGYPLNQTMTLDEALAFFAPSDGDFIVGQDGFAEYTDGQWNGTLEVFMPGYGYLYKSAVAAEIPFNTTIVSLAGSRAGKQKVLTASPWACDKHAHQSVMPLTARLVAGHTAADAADYVVAAFAGSECRGIARAKDGRLLMSVYGDRSEEIRFVAYDASTEQVFDIHETLGFSADNVGSWRSPYLLTLGSESTSIEALSGQLTVTPTVFSDHISVAAGGRNISRLTLTNMGGQQVLSATDLGTSATVAMGSLSDGMYILTLQAEGNTYYKKIVKANK